MPSFDIVSRTNLDEVDNAINGVKRELGERYDFKDTKFSVDRDKLGITLATADEFKLKQLKEVFAKYLVRRGIELSALEYKAVEPAAGGTVRQAAAIKQGIPQELAKKIVKAVKDSGLKVQAAIQGEELRVTGKKRDDLQAAIALVKSLKLDQPLQYINFRE
jgi:uncharacterized protein YajQ (UPF0234 family)